MQVTLVGESTLPKVLGISISERLFRKLKVKFVQLEKVLRGRKVLVLSPDAFITSDEFLERASKLEPKVVDAQTPPAFMVVKAGDGKLASALRKFSEGGKPPGYREVHADGIFRISEPRTLARAFDIIRGEIVAELMGKGVFIPMPESVVVSQDSEFSEGTIIEPCTFIISSKVCRAHIKYGSYVERSEIGREVIIGPLSVVIDSVVEEGAQVGPFARLRPGSVIKRGAKIGNFVEVKKSEIGEGSKVQHLSYIGDATLGRHVNIGAGTITCNYDGFRKHQTIIEDEVFIGSGNMLVAPLKIGRGAFTGAGSAITKDVPPDSLAVERSKQKVVDGWARKKRKKESS